MIEDPKAAARVPIRSYPLDHGEILPGDTFTWCGQLLRVEKGGIALGMPIRELTLNVSEDIPHATDDSG